jgi:hypothetical protein
MVYSVISVQISGYTPFRSRCINLSTQFYLYSNLFVGSLLMVMVDKGKGYPATGRDGPRFSG